MSQSCPNTPLLGRWRKPSLLQFDLSLESDDSTTETSVSSGDADKTIIAQTARLSFSEFASVYLYETRSEQPTRHFVIKRPLMDRGENEAHVLSCLPTHAHIVHFVQLEPDLTYRFVYHGDAKLRDALESLRPDAAFLYAHQLVEALQHCHRRGVAHRNVCIDNVILETGTHLRLCGFGFAFHNPLSIRDWNAKTTDPGPPMHSPPPEMKCNGQPRKTHVRPFRTDMYMLATFIRTLVGCARAKCSTRQERVLAHCLRRRTDERLEIHKVAKVFD